VEPNVDDILIIIPAYQEQNSIQPIVSTIKSMGYQVLVIDDCSRDSTSSMAEAAGADVIRLPANLGYGGALQTGYKYAWRNGYQYVVQLDADGQHNPSDIPRLLNPVSSGECDLAVGSRFLSTDSYKVPILRHTGIKLFSTILNILTHQNCTDPTSGYQAINRKTLQVFTTDAFPTDYPDADMLLMVYRAGLKTLEIPVSMRESRSGQSMHGGIIRPMYYIFRMLLGIMVTLLRKPPDKTEYEDNGFDQGIGG